MEKPDVNVERIQENERGTSLFMIYDCRLRALLEYWSTRVYEIPNSKHQISGSQVSGFRCQEKETQKLKPEH